ncbi:pyrroloquinoline quinone precursor peptide PqqA [Dankookia sp. P2]
MIDARPRRQSRVRVTSRRRSRMAWKTPIITEICLGLEINAYASATV